MGREVVWVPERWRGMVHPGPLPLPAPSSPTNSETGGPGPGCLPEPGSQEQELVTGRVAVFPRGGESTNSETGVRRARVDQQ